MVDILRWYRPSFMVSMVEYSHVACISVILLILILMLVYVLRLASLDLLNGFPGGVVRVSGISNHVHRINMAKTDLQWTIRVMSNSNPNGNENADSTSQEIYLQIQIRNNINDTNSKLIYRAYWGVNITSFHDVRISPWNWFIHAFEMAIYLDRKTSTNWILCKKKKLQILLM